MDKNDCTGNHKAGQNIDTMHSAQETESDPELDDLLDSALEDFNKPVAVPNPGTPNVSQGNAPPSSETKPHDGDHQSAELPSQDAMFNEVFNDESQKQLEDMMKAFMGQDPNMMKNIEKLAEAAGSSDDTEEGRKNFEQTLQDTLGNLAQNTEQLQGGVPDEDLYKLLGNFNIGDVPGAETEGASGGMGDMNSFMPMMQGMMKSLLSKDVLYPSLKDISEKYPNWLETNKDKTEPKELENYNKQFEYMKKICTEYEQELDSDSELVKKERFERVLEYMQNMQELGYPPKELVGDMPALEGAFGGLPNIAQASEQCTVM